VSDSWNVDLFGYVITFYRCHCLCIVIGHWKGCDRNNFFTILIGLSWAVRSVEIPWILVYTAKFFNYWLKKCKELLQNGLLQQLHSPPDVLATISNYSKRNKVKNVATAQLFNAAACWCVCIVITRSSTEWVSNSCLWVDSVSGYIGVGDRFIVTRVGHPCVGVHGVILEELQNQSYRVRLDTAVEGRTNGTIKRADIKSYICVF